ncbi:MAG: tRNA threonylcarbamoyladenosine dehydratase [Firmicutes bacterium]|nr:tRNA threonylcarbamoyladenosine dehydratase [Bacillota bacterium]MBT9158606.1 tRNA threonylcarbamoyladenosine dehydratase [Bacillota bacterium]
MLHRYSRTELLVGPQGLEKLSSARVAVIGVGGVGSFAVEALARAGIGSLTLVDYDDICLTNINRQLHALTGTIGRAKVEVMAERVRQIDPNIVVTAQKTFYSKDNEQDIIYPGLSYVIDAVDTVTAKLAIIARCHALQIPVISCMGAGNKLDPAQFQVADISKTEFCPLARIVRKELGKRGIRRGVKVVYSAEPPLMPLASSVDCTKNCVCPGQDANCARKRQIPGSISFVPAVAGLLAAGAVVRDLLGLAEQPR